MKVKRHLDKRGYSRCAECNKVRRIVDLKNWLCIECSLKRQLAGVEGVPELNIEQVPLETEPFHSVRNEPAERLPSVHQEPETDRDNGSAQVDPAPEPEEVLPEEPEEQEQPEDDEQFICILCGARIPAGSDYCPNCGILCLWNGTALEKKEGWLICPECHAARYQKNYCTRCGYGMEARFK